MKYATIALFLGVISAQEFDDELAEALKISITPAGQRAIEAEARDVKQVAMKIKNSQPVRNLEASFKRFVQSKEMHNIQKLDKAFLASPAGKRLVAEWKDVGELLKKHVTHDKKTNTLHLDNKHMDDLSDELDDVADQYKSLDGSKWEKAYDAAWRKAVASKQFKSLQRRAHAFKTSNEGKMLKKEVHELKMAVKKNLKVTDIPEDSDSSDDEEIEEVADLLKITITPAGEKEIESEAKDVKETLHKIKGTKVFQNLKMSIKRWLHSKEVKRIEAVEKRFLASPEGKRLVKEWHDFGVALKKHIKKTKNGIHIDNKALNGEINEEFDDVADQYDGLKGSKWDKQYHAAWKAALHNPESQQAKKSMIAFKHSAQGKMLKKEIVELKKSIKKNLKVTDLPKKLQDDSSSSDEEEDEFDFVAKKKVVAKKAKKEQESSSSDEEEELSVKKPKKKVAKKAKKAKKVKKAKDSSSDEEEEEENFDDVEELLKITVSPAGQKVIEKEWNDVEAVWDKIDDSAPVRNAQASLKRWAHSKEMQDLESLDKKFLATPRGKKMKAEIEDVFRHLDKTVYHNKQGLHIDNKELETLDDEMTDVADEMKAFKKSRWNKLYNDQMRKVFSNKQAQSLHRRLVAFEKSNEGQALKKEMHDFKMALKKNVKITDLPRYDEDENDQDDDLFLF